MNKKYILRQTLTMLLLMAGVTYGHCGNIFDNLIYYGRLGYNLGGTAPIGMPATIRSLSKFTIKVNTTIGLMPTNHLETDGE